MTEAVPTNVHGTAIVIGSRGILFVGASGSGKSAIAFACMAQARLRGAFTALVADDQVLISCLGDQLVAERPASIAGLIEIRGSGIVEVKSVPMAVLDLAVQLVSLPKDDRLPPEHERFDVAGIGGLPMVRLCRTAMEPLASIAAIFPEFRGERPF
jgi:serine kinase of HPr protein (carbohydrate metabolism regulator)